MEPHPDRFETLAERRIREAIEAGEFEDLPGEGKPLPGAGTADDEMWWVRSWLRRNSADGERE
jgi:hypothetical protein